MRIHETAHRGFGLSHRLHLFHPSPGRRALVFVCCRVPPALHPSMITAAAQLSAADSKETQTLVLVAVVVVVVVFHRATPPPKNNTLQPLATILESHLCREACHPVFSPLPKRERRALPDCECQHVKAVPGNRWCYTDAGRSPGTGGRQTARPPGLKKRSSTRLNQCSMMLLSHNTVWNT